MKTDIDSDLTGKILRSERIFPLIQRKIQGVLFQINTDFLLQFNNNEDIAMIISKDLFCFL